MEQRTGLRVLPLESPWQAKNGNQAWVGK